MIAQTSIFTIDSKKLEIDFKRFVFFDIETVENIETMQELANSSDINLEYLNPLNCKTLAFSFFTDEPQHFDFADVVKFDEKLKLQSVFVKADATVAAEILADFVKNYNFQGIAGYNSGRFDLGIFAKNKRFGIRKQKKSLAIYDSKNRKWLKHVDLLDTAKLLVTPANLKNVASKLLNEGKKLQSAKLADYNIYDTVLLAKLAMKFQSLQFKKDPTTTARYEIYKEFEKFGITKIYSKSKIYYDYSGGRTDIFKAYAKTCNVFDFNSLYPSVLANFKFPKIEKVGKKWKIRTTPISEKSANAIVSKFLNSFEVDEILQPLKFLQKLHDIAPPLLLFVKILGVRKEFEKFEKELQLYFPFSFIDGDGKRIFRLKTDEIYQIATYNITFLKFYEFEIIHAEKFKLDWNILKNFYITTYKKRQELKKRKDESELFYKIVMNSSYGILGLRTNRIVAANCNVLKDTTIEKFLQNSDRLRIVVDGKVRTDVNICRLSPNNLQIFNIENKTYAAGKMFDALSVPIYAVLTTAYAQFMLNVTIFSLFLQSYKIYYCDTDSIFTNATVSIFEKMQMVGNEMLQLKFEKSLKDFVAVAPKTYIAKSATDENIIFKSKGTGATPIKTFVVNNPYLQEFAKLQERKYIDATATPKYRIDENFEASYNFEKLKTAEALEPALEKISTIYPDYNIIEI